MTETYADGLEDPSGDEDPDDELLHMLHQCHHENPAQRKTMPLERFLEHCSVLSKTSIFGLLKATQESPRMTASASHRCMLAILKYFARIVGVAGAFTGHLARRGLP